MLKASRKAPIKIYQLFMLGLCVYVLTALALDTFLDLDKDVSDVLLYVDTGICLIFLLDFIGNLLFPWMEIYEMGLGGLNIKYSHGRCFKSRTGCTCVPYIKDPTRGALC